MPNSAETESIICIFAPADGESCNETAMMGGYCKTHYDSLVAEASLLNNLFYSSNASDNSAGESGGEEDDHDDNTPKKVELDKDGQKQQNDPMLRCDSLASVAMDWKTEDELDQVPESQEPAVPQQESTVANGAGGDAPTPAAANDAGGDTPTLAVANDAGGVTPTPAAPVDVEPEPLKTDVLLSDQPAQPTTQTTQPIAQSPPPTNKFLNQAAREEATGSPASIASASSIDTSSSKNGTLPTVAIDYLRGWILSRQHIEQPYPTDAMYNQMSTDTGVEKAKLRNWFV